MSFLTTLLSVVALLVVLVVIAFVGYVAYSIYVDVKKQTEKKLQQKNVVFTKDGMRVGVKELSAEKTAGKTQRVLVDAWKFAQGKSPPTTPSGETSGSSRLKSDERIRP